MVGALSFVPPGALQNYTASPARGWPLPASKEPPP